MQEKNQALVLAFKMQNVALDNKKRDRRNFFLLKIIPDSFKKDRIRISFFCNPCERIGVGFDHKQHYHQK